MNRGPGWNGVGDSARCLHFLQCLQPAVSNSDIEAVVDQADVGAHNSRHQDVADAMGNCVLVRHPALLDKVTLHTDLGGDRSHESRVIRRHAAYGDERVRTGRDRVRNDVFKLAQLVAPERKARIAVLALRIERSEGHTSELQSLMRISYAVFCLKKKNKYIQI